MDSEHSFSPDDTDEQTTTFSLADLVDSIAPQNREKKASLFCLTGRLMGKVFHLNDDTTEFGREAKDWKIPDPGVSRHHALIEHVGGKYILTDLRSTNGTICNGKRIEGPVVLSEGDEIRMGPGITFRFEFHDELDEQVRRRLYELATRDALTGLLNRRAFLEQLETEMAWCRRHKRLAALLWFDIDHFKKINDTFGHQAGDEVLRSLGKLLRHQCRREDMVGRVGGEEFAAIGRDLSEDQAKAFAERLRSQVEQHVFQWNDERIPVTISVGLAPCCFNGDVPISTAVTTWIANADSALYRAKRSGRNRVVVYDASMEIEEKQPPSR